MNTFHGKTCVVTGATSGIGRAVTERLLREGAEVYAVGRWRPALDELATLGAVPVRCDLRFDVPDKFPEHVDFVFTLAGDVLAPLPVLGGLVHLLGRVSRGGAFVVGGSAAAALGGLPGKYRWYQQEKQAAAAVVTLIRDSYALGGVRVVLASIGLVDTPIWQRSPIPPPLAVLAGWLGHSPDRAAQDILSGVVRGDDTIYAGAGARLAPVVDGEYKPNRLLRRVVTTAAWALLV